MCATVSKFHAPCVGSPAGVLPFCTALQRHTPENCIKKEALGDPQEDRGPAPYLSRSTSTPSSQGIALSPLPIKAYSSPPLTAFYKHSYSWDTLHSAYSLKQMSSHLSPTIQQRCINLYSSPPTADSDHPINYSMGYSTGMDTYHCVKCSKIYADPSKRLKLYFRPKDPYCHPLCANRFPTTTMILRVKKTSRGRSQAPGVAGSAPGVKIDMEIIGVVGTVYKFQGMSDFQYLAMHCSTDGSRTSLYDKVLLRKPEKEEFFHQEMPLNIPPPIFSRLDTPVDYYYRPNIHHREGYQPPQVSGENLIGLTRARRPHNAIFVNFEEVEAPREPQPAAVQNWKKLCTNSTDKRAEQEIKRLFSVRPVWSRNAIKANISIHPEKLKLLLPCVAYYMLTGPWRSLWVRFDYDPRKNSEAKIYQVLDFRIRCGVKYGYTPNDMPVKAKRSTYNYSLPITIKKPVPQAVTMQDLTHGFGTFGTSSNPVVKKSSLNKYKLKESSYIFREGTLPPYRQMFYQFCDLNVESLQAIIHRNEGTETPCTERDGWCLPKTSEQLRDAMCLMIKQIIRSKRPALFSGPSTSADSKEQLTYESDEEEEEEEEFHPSEGSENEMETELLDYVKSRSRHRKQVTQFSSP
ncbi:general transcription factor 3C polypeptide 5 isoform X3 [Ascaphus truei]|uniref:general transcription factor 3C polypeptide 5 isoform X3 n=1 Tax=Ascaphus truei TaxID=8439 RepID=UPI003F59BEBA